MARIVLKLFGLPQWHALSQASSRTQSIELHQGEFPVIPSFDPILDRGYPLARLYVCSLLIDIRVAELPKN